MGELTLFFRQHARVRNHPRQNSGTRLQEGAKINRSLLALANCINALTEGHRSVVGGA